MGEGGEEAEGEGGRTAEEERAAEATRRSRKTEAEGVLLVQNLEWRKERRKLFNNVVRI